MLNCALNDNSMQQLNDKRTNAQRDSTSYVAFAHFSVQLSHTQMQENVRRWPLDQSWLHAVWQMHMHSNFEHVKHVCVKKRINSDVFIH